MNVDLTKNIRVPIAINHLVGSWDLYEKPGLIDIQQEFILGGNNMSNRSGFLEGLIVGTILGGLSILVASPKSRKELQDKFQKLRDENEDVLRATQESTEDLIEKTKQSIESGFDKLGDIIKENQKVSAEDLLTSEDK